MELPEAIVELVSAGFGVSILAGWTVAPHVRWGNIASSRLTRTGLDIDWYAAFRETDGADSPGHRLAHALAVWCGETPAAFCGK